MRNFNSKSYERNTIDHFLIRCNNEYLFNRRRNQKRSHFAHFNLCRWVGLQFGVMHSHDISNIERTLTIIITDSGVVRDFVQCIEGYMVRFGPVKYFDTESLAHAYAYLEKLDSYTVVHETDNKSFVRDYYRLEPKAEILFANENVVCTLLRPDSHDVIMKQAKEFKRLANRTNIK